MKRITRTKANNDIDEKWPPALSGGHFLVRVFIGMAFRYC